MMKKILGILIIALLSSCKAYKDFREDYQKPKVRFVDLQGNSKPVELRTPSQNFEALSQQGKLTDSKVNSAPPIINNPKPIAGNKYADPQDQAQYQDLQQTLSLPTEQPKQDENQPKKISAQQNKIKEIKYDLGKEEAKPQTKTTKAVKKSTKKKRSSYAVSKGYYAQAGSFRSNSHAKEQIAKVKKITPSYAKFKVQKATVKGKRYYRVLIGPYKSKKQAKSMVKSLKNKGQSAILVKIKK